MLQHHTNPYVYITYVDLLHFKDISCYNSKLFWIFSNGVHYKPAWFVYFNIMFYSWLKLNYFLNYFIFVYLESKLKKRRRDYTCKMLVLPLVQEKPSVFTSWSSEQLHMKDPIVLIQMSWQPPFDISHSFISEQYKNDLLMLVLVVWRLIWNVVSFDFLVSIIRRGH